VRNTPIATALTWCARLRSRNAAALNDQRNLAALAILVTHSRARGARGDIELGAETDPLASPPTAPASAPNRNREKGIDSTGLPLPHGLLGPSGVVIPR